MASLTLHIEGMSCNHCLNAVRRGLGAVTGVTVKTVTMGRAEVEYEPGAVPLERITDAVRDAGYQVTGSAGD